MAELGPQLIGQTEKALNAVLAQRLAPFGLSEPEWVTLRLASQRPERMSLTAFVMDQSHLVEAPAVVGGLHDRGLLDDDVLTVEGRQVVQAVQASITEALGEVWSSLDPCDAEAAARALEHVRLGCLRALRG